MAQPATAPAAPESLPALNHRLAELDRSEIRARAEAGAVGVLPVGALEQHGDHLPVGTDALTIEQICLRAASQAASDVLVLPALWTGFSPHHLRFGATVSLRADTFLRLLRDVVRTVRAWLPQLVLVNGHGGNRGTLTVLALEEGCPAVNYWELVDHGSMTGLFPGDLGSIGHAGQAETSIMLASAPALVGTPPESFEPIRRENDAFLVPDMGVTGVLGNPAAASSQSGERFLAAVVAALAAYLDQLPNPKEGAL